MADMAQTVDLDSTIALFQNGLTSIPPEAAIRNIEAWQEQLQGTEVAETLGELKLALDNGTGGSSIGDILTDLGSQTSAAAGSAPSSQASKLEQLGQLITQAASSL
jgi:hypothetical protein